MRDRCQLQELPYKLQARYEVVEERERERKWSESKCSRLVCLANIPLVIRGPVNIVINLGPTRTKILSHVELQKKKNVPHFIALCVAAKAGCTGVKSCVQCHKLTPTIYDRA